MSDTAFVQLENVTKRFDENTVLDEVDLRSPSTRSCA